MTLPSLSIKLLCFSAVTRLLVIILQAVFNTLIPDHDAGVFNPPQAPPLTVADHIVHTILRGFVRWDAVYFLHVAEYGYTYENCLAFFPLYPFVVRFLSNSVFYPLQFILSYSYVILTVGLITNVYCFILAAQTLYKVSIIVLKDERLAYKSALLFCITPASIFMTAPYSEAMFAYICFKAMLHLEEERVLKSVFKFGISAVARSNGIIASGFVLYKIVKDLFHHLQSSNVILDLKTKTQFILKAVCLFSLPILFYAFVAILPFAYWQLYTYHLYCHRTENITLGKSLIKYGRVNKLQILGDVPSGWCHDTIPLSYSYIQKHYWNVGFLNYYELKQIPNFLLALPVVILSISAALEFYRHKPDYCQRLGLMQGKGRTKKDDGHSRDNGFYGDKVFVYIVHMLFLTIFGVLFMHIQVLTRFLASSTPVVYWYAAWMTSPRKSSSPTTLEHEISAQSHDSLQSDRKTEKIEHKLDLESEEQELVLFRNIVTEQISSLRHCDWRTKTLYVYFISYFIIGTAMFSNFLPWT